MSAILCYVAPASKRTMIHFPSVFFWGSAASSHQVEGSTDNNWTLWEKEHAAGCARNARNRWQEWQQKDFPEMHNARNYISGRACDHYNRYEEDFDLAKLGGHNAHRFSIEWSRVEPEENVFDENEIEHYRNVIRALRERGMEPFVTLWHWTEPRWFSEKGGWKSRDAIGDFCRYVEKIVRMLNGHVTYWIVVNEPNVYTRFSYLKGTQPPGARNLYSFLRAYFHLLGAYKESYRLIHSVSPCARVGFTNSFVCYESDLPNPVASGAVGIARYFSRYFLNHTRGFNDFIGCNYYSRAIISLKKRILPDHMRSDLGWEIYPQGIYKVLKEATGYGLPIYVMENGIADADDSKRAGFIRAH